MAAAMMQKACYMVGAGWPERNWRLESKTRRQEALRYARPFPAAWRRFPNALAARLLEKFLPFFPGIPRVSPLNLPGTLFN
jgi:hypothetical protein